jgi:hypothetical protein
VKHEKMEGVSYDPYVANHLTDRVGVEVRRRHALEDARKEHFRALNNLMDAYDAKIVAVHAHFDAMAKTVRRAA